MKYLIFGGTGSLGKKLISRFLINGDKIAVYSRDEAKHWTIKNELNSSSEVEFFVGDIRDYNRVKEVILHYKPQVIIVAAALKQVDTCELSPFESVMTNLLGTQNVVKSVKDISQSWGSDWRIEKVLFVSTDKACSPVNVYGMCKGISERLVTSQSKNDSTGVKFLCTRYGNVLESRGSIIPLFKYQAEYSENLTVTDPDMTRFVMTLDDSVDLILEALKRGESGETWIPKIPAMRIGDLAEIFSSLYKKQIKIIGLRPGEKKHEDLINESESVRTKDVETHYVIGPAYQAGSNDRFMYTSADDVMTKDQLFVRLKELGIIDMSLDNFQGLKIEEIATNRKN
jgi:UDP-glucose 4-epimerase